MTNASFKRIHKITIAGMVIILCNYGCTLSFGLPVSGKVMYEGSGKPVENAYVAVKQKGTAHIVVESQSVCLHVDTDITNENGQYHTSAWHRSTGSRWSLWTADGRPVIYIYKYGYTESRQEGNDTYLKPFTGSTNERLDELSRIASSTSCSDSPDSEKTLVPLLRAMSEEARTIASDSVDDQSIVNYLLYMYESLEFGYEIATNRMNERNEGILK